MTLRDVPHEAADKSAQALQELEGAIEHVRIVLEAQRALLAAGDHAVVADLAESGAAAVATIATCGRRVMPVREALAGRGVGGPRADELRRRLAATDRQVAALATAAASLAHDCSVERARLQSELNGLQHSSAARPGYAAPPVASMLDTTG